MGGGRISGIGVASFLVTGALGTALGAQAPEPPQVARLPTQGVEVVRVDVVVSEKGRPRPGLKREDFTVLEDGKPQTLVQFAAYGRRWPDGASAPAAPAAANVNEAVDLFPRRHVVLVIDDVHMDFANLVRAQKALGRFVEEDLEEEDQVALLTTSGARALSQEFTPDRAVLAQVISRLAAQNRQAEWSGVPQISEYQAELIEAGDPTALDAAVQETMQASLFQDAASAEEQSRRKAHAIFTEAVYNSRLTLETLESLTRGLAGTPGRKVLFLVSDGFLTGLSAGSGSGFDMRRIVDAGTSAGVVIYALDTRGLTAPPPGASASSRTRTLPSTFGLVDSMQRRSEEATRDAMQALAAGTGGFLVHNANDLRAGLRRMLKDTETYYVLAYEPTNGARDGSFRHIEVRVPGVRDVKVRARAGYFAPDDRRAGGSPGAPEAQPSREQERRWGMRTTLNSIAPLTGIPVQLSADFVAVDDGMAQVVVSGHVDATTLPFLHRNDRYQDTVETVAVVYDEAGAVAATLETQRVSMDLTAGEHEQVLKAGLQYQKSVALKPGRYQVRLAAREDTEGKPGSAWQWVQIPDLASGQLTLSSLFLLRASESAATAAAPAADGGAGLVLQNAQALRHFRRDENLYVQLYAYNPTRDGSGATNLVSQAEILKDGALLGSAAPEPMAQGEPKGPPVPHTSRIRLRSFEPGTYELRVAVTDRNANETASRRVGFTVD